MSPAEQHQSDAARFTTIVASASPGDWSRPSPVAEWNARGVVEHLVEWLPGFLERADVTLPAVDVAANPAGAWQQRVDDVQRLIESKGHQEFTSPMFGTTTVGAAIDRFYTADIWMHSWDLAKALGQEIDLGQERCASALAGMEPMEEMIRQSGQFGQRVAVPDDASAQDRFIGFIGRDPAWSPS